MKISDAKTMLTSLFQYNLEQWQAGKPSKYYLVPHFEGDPGVGKTAFIGQVAEELTVPHHKTIIAQYDAGEMGGFGIPTDVLFVNEDGSEYKEKRVIRARPDYLPDPRTEDGVIGLWNLDELPQAVLANQNICSQIVNEWRLGEHLISGGITICCTGNKPENKAGTTTMPMHLKDRLMFITIEADYHDFMNYAVARGLHPLIRGAIKKNPSWLHKFQIGVKAFPSPRSWERASTIINLKQSKSIERECLVGQIGDGMTTEFLTYCLIEERMPDPFEVVKDPMNAPIFGSADADVLFLLISNLVNIADKKNLPGMIQYLKRLENQEFVALWARDCKVQHPELQKTQELTDYKIADMKKLFY